MNSNLTGREINQCVEQVLEELKITTLPVNPFSIAKVREIMCKAQSMDGCSGCFIKAGDNFGILYSPDFGNEGAIRFTVAHELGHYFLPGHPQRLFPSGSGRHQSNSGFTSNEPQEREADLFAAGLLMPTKLFLDALRKETNEGFRTIESLSRLCRTSLTATAIRFVEYIENPVAVIVRTGDKINFCCMSEAMKSVKGVWGLRKGAWVPSASKTQTFNKNSAKVQNGERVEGFSYLDAWCDGAPQIEMKEDVVGLGRYGKSLTVLFADKPLESENEEEDLY